MTDQDPTGFVYRLVYRHRDDSDGPWTPIGRPQSPADDEVLRYLRSYAAWAAKGSDERASQFEYRLERAQLPVWEPTD